MKSLWKSFFTAVFFLFILTNAATGDEPLPKARQTPLPESEFKAHFHPIPFAQVTGKRFSVGPFLITGGNREHYNSMTAGWGGFGVLWSKPVATIYVRTERFTYRFLEAEPVFTLSFYPSSCNKAILTVYGRKSGRDTDKEKITGFTPVATPGGGVSYLQADLVLVCRRVLRFGLTKDAVPPEIAKGVSSRSYHVQYTGEVIGVWKRNP